MLSRASHYAISGILRLSTLPPGGYCRVEDLVAGTNAPKHAVGKVFQTLARHRVLSSVRGARGGFRLSPNAMQLTLLEIVEIVDGPFQSIPVIERGVCLSKHPCPLADLLQPTFDQLRQALKNTRVCDLAPHISGKCCANAETNLHEPIEHQKPTQTLGGT